ncbi:MAG: secretin N-terminal domain-containing protein [Candidatus Spyradenecus sp.]
MNTSHLLLTLSAGLLLSGAAVAQVRAPAIRRTNGNTPAGASANAATSTTEVAQQLAKAERGKGGRPKLKFDNAPAELFLQIYAQVTGRTLLTSPDVPKVTMSLRSNNEEKWSDAEYLQAIEQQLQLNGIGLIPVGERFALVVPFKTIGQQGIETFLEIPAKGRHPEEGKIIRQVITPKNISAEEAQKVVENFKRPDGMIQFLERTNSLLITDTQENVNRMIEIIAFIDKPMPVLEEVQVYGIKHAKAADIKKSLEEFVQASREEDEKSKKSTAAPRTSNSLSGGMQKGVSISQNRNLPGVTRPGSQPAEEPSSGSSVVDALVSDADRGMIRGKVQIMADERSNQLIIVTRPSNMAFFERIIKVLDIETAPEIAVEIIRLKYAQAETKDSNKGVADLLNELIDSSASSKTNEPATRNTNNQPNRRNLTNSNRPAVPTPPQLSADSKSKIGELRKENIKILADSRINAVMVMASPGDLAAIKDIIAEMDVPVAQVLIETVVLSVTLGDDLTTGVEWVKRVSGGNKYRDSFGGGGMPSGASSSPQNLFNLATNVTSALGMISGGSQYYGTINKLNLDFLIRATELDNRTKVITSPILMTQDNKEATLENTELAYLYNGMKYMGSSYSGSDYQPDIKQEEIGLTIKVTPRINPDGTVVLTFEETFQNADNKQEVPGSGTNGESSMWPSPSTRKISGNISVNDGQTVVIGGLVEHKIIEEEGGIPFLKNIPWIGRYLFGYTDFSDSRSELLVFLTPYVFKSSEEAQAEAKRRKDYLDAPGVWNKGWSNSTLADIPDEEEMLRRENQKRAYETKQFKAKEKRSKAQLEHDRKMAELLEKSIDRKREELIEERKRLSNEALSAREAELLNEQLMHEALLRSIMESEGNEAE